MALFKKPNYSTIRPGSLKRDVPQGVWQKCKQCNEGVFARELEDNLYVCPHCNFHYPLTWKQRLQLISDPNHFHELDAKLQSIDILQFKGPINYTEKLSSNQEKTGLLDAVVCAEVSIENQPVALGIMDFRFLGASMGSVVGEKVARLTEYATQKRRPLLIITASGGARMYEGILSLMQMAKTSAVLAKHHQEGLAYIVVLTHPTTAGVMASFASLGDIILSEPGAMIGFAGQRVITQTIQSKLPSDFQTAEFLLRKGFIDRIIERKTMKKELAQLLNYFSAAYDR